MSGQDMRNLMEMAMGQQFVFVISYDGVPVRASMESDFAYSYAKEYKQLLHGDSREKVTVHQVGLGPDTQHTDDFDRSTWND